MELNHYQDLAKQTDQQPGTDYEGSELAKHSSSLAWASGRSR